MTTWGRAMALASAFVFSGAATAVQAPASGLDDGEGMALAARDRGGRFDGLWCGAGLLRGASLQLRQHRSEFDGVLRFRNRSRDVNGSIDGSTLRTVTQKAGELVLQLQGVRLRIEEAGGNLALAQGQSFVRASGEGCD